MEEHKPYNAEPVTMQAEPERAVIQLTVEADALVIENRSPHQLRAYHDGYRESALPVPPGQVFALRLAALVGAPTPLQLELQTVADSEELQTSADGEAECSTD